MIPKHQSRRLNVTNLDVSTSPNTTASSKASPYQTTSPSLDQIKKDLPRSPIKIYLEYSSNDYLEIYLDYRSNDYLEHRSKVYIDYRSNDYLEFHLDYRSNDYLDYRSKIYLDYRSIDYLDHRSNIFLDYSSIDYLDYRSNTTPQRLQDDISDTIEAISIQLAPFSYS